MHVCHPFLVDSLTHRRLMLSLEHITLGSHNVWEYSKIKVRVYGKHIMSMAMSVRVLSPARRCFPYASEFALSIERRQWVSEGHK